jgi:hypothetical protein
MPAENKLKATIPVPDHSDLRGFSYRAPTNTQGYNDDPRKARPRSGLKGQLSSRKVNKGFWASMKDFFRGKKEVAERPLSPELVSHIRAVEPLPEQTSRDEDFTPRPVRELPRDRDASNIWPG